MEHYGWRVLLAIGAFPLLALPVIRCLLPESIEFPLSKDRFAEAHKLAERMGIPLESVRNCAATVSPQTSLESLFLEVFSRRKTHSAVFLWGALFMVMILVCGFGTWLPQIMRKSGYALAPSLYFLVVFSLVSALGGIGIARAADRIGERTTISVAFLLGAVSIAALSIKSSMATNYVLVGCAGVGSIAALRRACLPCSPQKKTC